MIENEIFSITLFFKKYFKNIENINRLLLKH